MTGMLAPCRRDHSSARHGHHQRSEPQRAAAARAGAHLPGSNTLVSRAQRRLEAVTLAVCERLRVAMSLGRQHRRCIANRSTEAIDILKRLGWARMLPADARNCPYGRQRLLEIALPSPPSPRSGCSTSCERANFRGVASLSDKSHVLFI